VKVFFVKYNFLSIIYNYNFLIDWKQRVRLLKKYIIAITSLNNSYLYIKAAKSYFHEPREKLSPRPLAAKDFVAKVYTTFCVQPKICNYKMSK
jgi:hypothetical protein